MYIEDLIKEYAAGGLLMQVTTCNSGQPWIAHVWYAFDEHMHFYFISNRARRHSKEIRVSSKVACGIVHPHLEGLGQKVRGLTFEGLAQEIGGAGTDLDEAYWCYSAKWPNTSSYIRKDDIIRDLTPVRFYRIQPTLFVLFDEVNFPDNPRQELPWHVK
jgi:uncharacterized protein YhbP (UPF0306 family)